jgi:16S rRNA processing protein RimM
MAASSILVGVIGKPHGVRGLLHVHSFTADPEDLARYSPLQDDAGKTWSLAWRSEGVAELRDAAGRAVSDRTEAEKLVNVKLHVARDRLPPAGADEFYLADLVGMEALDTERHALGRVATVHDYGAGASLEIDRPGKNPLLVPFTRACVPVVDLSVGTIIVVPPQEIDLGEPAA